MRLPHIRTDLLRNLIRRRLFITLPLAAAIVLGVSALSKPVTFTPTTSNQQHPTTLQPLTKSQAGTSAVLGESTSNNDDTSAAGHSSSQSSSTTVTGNSDGSTTVSGSTGNTYGDGTVSSPEPTDPPLTTAPCNTCPEVDSYGNYTACPNYCSPAPGTCNPCGGTTYRYKPGVMCPMYACMFSE